MQLEGLCKLEKFNSVTSSGLKLTTFQLVAQCPPSIGPNNFELFARQISALCPVNNFNLSYFPLLNSMYS
jgi:hypothetical protein